MSYLLSLCRLRSRLCLADKRESRPIAPGSAWTPLDATMRFFPSDCGHRWERTVDAADHQSVERSRPFRRFFQQVTDRRRSVLRNAQRLMTPASFSLRQLSIGESPSPRHMVADRGAGAENLLSLKGVQWFSPSSSPCCARTIVPLALELIVAIWILPSPLSKCMVSSVFFIKNILILRFLRILSILPDAIFVAIAAIRIFHVSSRPRKLARLGWLAGFKALAAIAVIGSAAAAVAVEVLQHDELPTPYTIPAAALTLVASVRSTVLYPVHH